MLNIDFSINGKFLYVLVWVGNYSNDDLCHLSWQISEYESQTENPKGNSRVCSSYWVAICYARFGTWYSLHLSFSNGRQGFKYHELPLKVSTFQNH